MSTHPFSNLDQLFADGLIQAVMKADRVDPRALRTLLGGVAGRAAARWRESARKPTGSLFATPRLEWRGARGGADAPAHGLPAAIDDACGAGACC